jgi:hypothetical protein
MTHQEKIIMFGNLKSAAHTFFGFLGKVLASVIKEEPKIADALSGSIKYIDPLIVDIVTVEFGAGAGAIADSAIKEVLLDSTALKSLIYDWQNSPGIVAKFRALAADTTSLISLGHIKSTTSIAKATRIASEATAAADEAEAALTPAVA